VFVLCFFFHKKVIDLEHLASHRGSALGRFNNEAPQPSQKYFESLLANEIATLNLEEPVWVEAESSRIGNVQIPQEFWQNMRQSPRVIVSIPLAARVDAILKVCSCVVLFVC
jgi:tRNA 2-selenouridine synthase